MKKITILFIFALSMSYAFAQKDKTAYVKDPNHNPKLWKEILLNPNDQTLWAKYMGRASWSALSASEKERINIWKRDMTAAVKAKRSDGTPTSFSPTEEKKPLTAEEKKLAKIKEAEEDGKTVITRTDKINFDAFMGEYLKDSPQMKELKKNMLANFKVIEDGLFEKYAEFDRDYTYYHEIHPDEDYSFEKWITEHETKVRKWRQERLGELSANYVVIGE